MASGGVPSFARVRGEKRPFRPRRRVVVEGPGGPSGSTSKRRGSRSAGGGAATGVDCSVVSSTWGASGPPSAIPLFSKIHGDPGWGPERPFGGRSAHGPAGSPEGRSGSASGAAAAGAFRGGPTVPPGRADRGGPVGLTRGRGGRFVLVGGAGIELAGLDGGRSAGSLGTCPDGASGVPIDCSCARSSRGGSGEGGGSSPKYTLIDSSGESDGDWVALLVSSETAAGSCGRLAGDSGEVLVWKLALDPNSLFRPFGRPAGGA